MLGKLKISCVLIIVVFSYSFSQILDEYSEIKDNKLYYYLEPKFYKEGDVYLPLNPHFEYENEYIVLKGNIYKVYFSKIYGKNFCKICSKDTILIEPYSITETFNDLKSFENTNNNKMVGFNKSYGKIISKDTVIYRNVYNNIDIIITYSNYNLEVFKVIKKDYLKNKTKGIEIVYKIQGTSNEIKNIKNIKNIENTKSIKTGRGNILLNKISNGKGTLKMFSYDNDLYFSKNLYNYDTTKDIISDYTYSEGAKLFGFLNATSAGCYPCTPDQVDVNQIYYGCDNHYSVQGYYCLTNGYGYDVYCSQSLLGFNSSKSYTRFPSLATIQNATKITIKLTLNTANPSINVYKYIGPFKWYTDVDDICNYLNTPSYTSYLGIITSSTPNLTFTYDMTQTEINDFKQYGNFFITLRNSYWGTLNYQIMYTGSCYFIFEFPDNKNNKPILQTIMQTR